MAIKLQRVLCPICGSLCRYISDPTTGKFIIKCKRCGPIIEDLHTPPQQPEDENTDDVMRMVV